MDHSEDGTSTTYKAKKESVATKRLAPPSGNTAEGKKVRRKIRKDTETQIAPACDQVTEHVVTDPNDSAQRREKEWHDDLYEAVSFAFNLVLKDVSEDLLQEKRPFVLGSKSVYYSMGYELAWSKTTKWGAKTFKSWLPLRQAMQSKIVKDRQKILAMITSTAHDAHDIRSQLNNSINSARHDEDDEQNTFTLERVISLLGGSVCQLSVFADFVSKNISKPLRMQSGYRSAMDFASDATSA